MPRRVWKIRGYENDQPVYEQSLPAGSLTDQEMILLLQRLASRHLSDGEVISGSLNRNAKEYEPHLEVRRERWTFTTGGSRFHYTAAVEDDG
jgi:hypothetical protein